MAGDAVIGADRPKFGRLGAAALSELGGKRTSGVEPAAGRRRNRRRYFAAEHNALTANARIGNSNRRHQRLRVGVGGGCTHGCNGKTKK